jgi:hypothetical protein
LRWGLLGVAAASMSGCTTALDGAAVGASPNPAAVTVVQVPTSGLAHQFGGPANLLANGSFDAGTSPWVTMDSTIVWTKKPHRFGKTALLARPTRFGPFGARVEIAALPAAPTAFTFSGWVRGKRGSEVIAQLYANMRSGKAVVIGTSAEILRGRWQRISVRGRLVLARTEYVSGAIYVFTRISLTSWLAIDGVKATQTSETPSK